MYFDDSRRGYVRAPCSHVGGHASERRRSAAVRINQFIIRFARPCRRDLRRWPLMGFPLYREVKEHAPDKLGPAELLLLLLIADDANDDTRLSFATRDKLIRWREDTDGRRLIKSIIAARNLNRRGALHPTEKPPGILLPLIRYSCPVGGRVVDPFAGSGSTLAAARLSGRESVGIEADERYCEVIATRLGQGVMFDGEGDDPPPPPVPDPPPASPLF